jgi:hypothetical protein
VHDFAARALCSITGTVLIEGRPLADVAVDAGPFGRTYTDAFGLFAFQYIEEGTNISLTLKKSGFAITPDSAQVSPVGDMQITFSAVERVDLRGIVLHRGTALSGVEIDAGDLGKRITDSYGRFIFPEVPKAASYRMSAWKQDYRIRSEMDTGKVQERLLVVFQAVKLVTLKGTVCHQGQPMPGVKIDGGKLGQRVTGRDGKYQFIGVPEGSSFRLCPLKEGFKFTFGGPA